jgi:glutamate-1-semialdehyde aminotransferase
MEVLKKHYLEHLIACINKQCRATKDHIDLYRSIFSNNRNLANYSPSLKELVFTLGIRNSAGSHFSDLNGNDYLDMTMGFGVHLFGHRPSFIEKALYDQINKGLTLGPIYETAAEVAELIHELTGNERCAFYNTGTEAVMVAMRIAKAATNKDKVVIFEGCYHGTHDSLLGLKKDQSTHSIISTIPGISQNFVNNTMILEYGNSDSIEIIRRDGHQIAAVLIEPVMSRHPELANSDFLHGLRAVCSELDITLIFDEVITGFRTANNGAAGFFNVQPDVTTYGKIAGGGIPVGIVAGKRRYLDMIDGGKWQFGDQSGPGSNTTFTAGTFNHHPLAMAAAKATLQFLKAHEGRLQRDLNLRTRELCDKLNTFYEEEGFPISMVSFSSLFRFKLKGNHKILFYSLLKEGIYIWEGRNCFLSTAHMDADLTYFIERVKKCCFELEAAGILSRKKSKQFIEKRYELKAGIKVKSTLDRDSLALACNYLFSSIPKLRGNKCVYVENKNGEMEKSKDGSSDSFVVTISTAHETTLIHVAAEREMCDGWSIILFFKALANSYNAIKRGLPLPLMDYQDDEAICSVNNHSSHYNPAKTLHHTIPLALVSAQTKKRLFALMMAHFHQTISEQDLGPNINCDTICVPMAGQLLNRKLKVFGQCTIHKDITITGGKSAYLPEILRTIETKIKSIKLSKATHELKETHSDIVFNLDNLDFSLLFDDQAASFIPIDESSSAFPVVCNITKLKSSLIISLKYSLNHLDENQAKLILNAYIDKIKQDIA